MRNFLVIFLLSCGNISYALADPEPILNEEYVVINDVGLTSSDQNFVLEFFSYACVHCYHFEPELQSWLEVTSSDMVFRRVPAIFSDKMIPLAKLYYTLEDMGKLQDFHEKIFKLIHVDKKRIYTKKLIMDWASNEPGIDYDVFLKVFNSFSVGRKVSEAKRITRKYRIPGTPYITIGGKYLTGPSMISERDSKKNRGERLFIVIENLIEKAG